MEITLPTEAVVEVVAGTELTINGPVDMVTYAWSVTLAPPNSVAQPAPTDTRVTVFTPVLAGNYRLHLEVFGDGENQDLRLRVVSPKTRKAPPTPGEFKEFGGWGSENGLRGIYTHLEEVLGSFVGFYDVVNDLPAGAFDGAVAWVSGVGFFEYDVTAEAWFQPAPPTVHEHFSAVETTETYTLEFTPEGLQLFRNGLLTTPDLSGKVLTFSPPLEENEDIDVYYTPVPD